MRRVDFDLIFTLFGCGVVGGLWLLWRLLEGDAVYSYGLLLLSIMATTFLVSTLRVWFRELISERAELDRRRAEERFDLLSARAEAELAAQEADLDEAERGMDAARRGNLT